MKATIVPIPMPKQIKSTFEDSGKESKGSINPLSPLAGLMKLCVILGFPLKMDGLTLKSVSSNPYLKYWPLASYLVIINLGQIPMSLVLYQSGVTFENILETSLKQGHTIMDLLAIFGIFLPQTLGMIRQNLHLLNIPHRWNSLNTHLTGFLSKDDICNCNSETKRDRYLVLGLYFMFVLTPLVMTHYFYEDLVPIQIKLLLCGINLYTCALAYYPLMLFAIFAILNHYILLFNKTLIHFNRRIQGLLANTNSETDLAILLNDGVKLVKALSSLDSTFGKLLFVESALCLLTETFGIYFGTLISKSITDANLYTFFIGSTFVLLGIQGFARFYILTQNGQVLTHTMKECHANLNLLDIQSTRLTQVQEKQMRVTLTRFSQSAAWRPMDLFDLSQASLLTVHSAIITYLVVLIQFKDAEAG